MKAPSEHDIQGQILSWLKLKRLFHYRQNSGAHAATYNGKKRFFRYGTPGTPDIVCIIKGQYIGIEVKGKYGQQSQNQVCFQQELERAGGHYILARSLDDAIARINSL